MNAFRVTGLFTPRPSITVGLDLGQSQDYSAAVVMRKVPPPDDAPEGTKPGLHVPYIRRWPLGTSYVAVVKDVVKMFADPALSGHDLIVDTTGCGRPVLDMLREEKPAARVVGVLITGGAIQHFTKGLWHVAKTNLISVTQVAMQKRVVKFAEKLKETELIVRELENYRMKLSLQAHEVYAAKDSEHDDLIIALALAAWGQDNAGRWAVRFETIDPDAAAERAAETGEDGLTDEARAQLPGAPMWPGGPTPEEYEAELKKLMERPPDFLTGADINKQDGWSSWL
jgi:hypothetical protein